MQLVNTYNFRTETLTHFDTQDFKTEQSRSTILNGAQQNNSDQIQTIDSKDQVDELIDDLNKAIVAHNKNIKFGDDSLDVFFVSIIDSLTNKIIRRFSSEQLVEILPKMEQSNGILFDSKI